MSDQVTEQGRTRVGSRSALAVAIGLGVIADVSVLLLITWPAGALVLGMSFLFGVLALIWAVLFSSREEPSQRLVDLIRALRGPRRRHRGTQNT